MKVGDVVEVLPESGYWIESIKGAKMRLVGKRGWDKYGHGRWVGMWLSEHLSPRIESGEMYNFPAEWEGKPTVRICETSLVQTLLDKYEDQV